ncbi:MAG: cupin domain-containing protein [Actinobacteria bacterium]|nr:cupin domain-containing protein [Actinomycetota bacterium]MBI3687749.1 cupin domain-containing protein [Actinomycetota bacterium]
MTFIEPAHSSFTDGDPFDLGTHANDFHVRRENSLATETFTVRVPGGGEVPCHVHDDMEQTFVFISGIGEAILARGDDQRRYRCRPGDVLFVPTGWSHGVAAASPEGCVYVTVDSFVPHSHRVGQDADEHARIAAAGFREREKQATSVLSHLDDAALLRAAEASFRPSGDGRLWCDPGPLRAVSDRDPGTYRIRTIGPFEYAASTTPTSPLMDTALADRIHATVAGRLPVFVEGSQSPLSIKPPHPGSDLDILLAVENPRDLTVARHVVGDILTLTPDVPLRVSPGVVYTGWLRLPFLYSAVNLAPDHPDRRWFTATTDTRRAEILHRQRTAMQALTTPGTPERLLREGLRLAGEGHDVLEWRLVPRWKGLL